MLDAKEVRIEDDRRYLTFECKICNNAIRIRDHDEMENCVYRTEFTMRAQKMKIDPECIKDPTLTRRGDVLCPYCGHNEAVTFTQGVGDKVQLVFVCTHKDCKQHWFKREEDENEVFSEDSQ